MVWTPGFSSPSHVKILPDLMTSQVPRPTVQGGACPEDGSSPMVSIMSWMVSSPVCLTRFTAARPPLSLRKRSVAGPDAKFEGPSYVQFSPSKESFMQLPSTSSQDIGPGVSVREFGSDVGAEVGISGAVAAQPAKSVSNKPQMIDRHNSELVSIFPSVPRFSSRSLFVIINNDA